MKKIFKKIAVIAGARPNFMKATPLCREMAKQKLDYFLINTGQHFSKDMAAGFFREFKIKPNYSLTPSRQSTIRQFADILTGIEEIFNKEKPSLAVVVGDVNSTLAGALTANKMGIKLAHVEAGLRSYNDKMPEEVNRVITDRLANLLFVSEKEAVKNLNKEGITKDIHLVGNIMIDTMELFLNKIKDSAEKFYFCTLHRAENVDDKDIFAEILDALEIIAQDNTIYLPLHPRTKKMAEEFGLLKKINKIFTVLPPLNYRWSLYYQKNAQLVLTDSGGVQEETSYLGTPCITLRTETERPVTVTRGTNTIGGVTARSILAAYRAKNFARKKVALPYWDGRTAERIVAVIKKQHEKFTGID